MMILDRNPVALRDIKSTISKFWSDFLTGSSTGCLCRMQKVELHRFYITSKVHIFLNLIYSQTDSHKELSTIIEKAKHRWLLRLLHYGLNIGITFDDLKSRDEKSINTLLENFQKPSKLSNNVNAPKQEYDYPQNAGRKAEIMILPLSIDDETTTSGTASILQNYSKEFGLQCERSNSYIPKDHMTGKFNLSAARERFLFYQGLKYHHEEMKVFRKTLEDNDKHITDEQGEDSSDSVHDSDSEGEVTEGNGKQLNFKEFCAKVEQTMKNAMAKLKSCTSGNNLQQSAMILRERQSEWLLLEDQFKRTCLHLAVEEHDLQLAESLLVSGAEINKPEGCGVTPVMIAIIKEQSLMVQLLLKYNAKTHGTFTGLIPPPSELVESIDNPAIKAAILQHINEEVKEAAAVFAEYLDGKGEVELSKTDVAP